RFAGSRPRRAAPSCRSCGCEPSGTRFRLSLPPWGGPSRLHDRELARLVPEDARTAFERHGTGVFGIGKEAISGLKSLSLFGRLMFSPDEAFARHLDAADPLARFRDHFHLPRGPVGQPAIYFCGHSLGLQPKAVRGLIDQELTDWADLGVEGHFRGTTPWYSYHEIFREAGARLVGARPGEVVMMNSLTVNLHLMMATFYRPTPGRFKILM